MWWAAPGLWALWRYLRQTSRTDQQIRLLIYTSVQYSVHHPRQDSYQILRDAVVDPTVHCMYRTVYKMRAQEPVICGKQRPRTSRLISSLPSTQTAVISQYSEKQCFESGFRGALDPDSPNWIQSLRVSKWWILSSILHLFPLNYPIFKWVDLDPQHFFNHIKSEVGSITAELTGSGSTILVRRSQKRS